MQSSVLDFAAGLTTLVGVLASMGGVLFLAGRILRLRRQNRVRIERAVWLGLHSRGGAWSLVAILLGLLLLLVPGFSPSAPEVAGSTFSAPRNEDAQPANAAFKPVAVADPTLDAVADQAPDPPPDPASEENVSSAAVRLDASMNTDALTRAIARAPEGGHIRFASGSYALTRTISLPCKGLHLSGPEGKIPAAILSAGFRNSDIFAFTSGCADLGSIRYLHFQNTGAVYFGGGDNGNFAFEHNLVTSLPSGLSNGGSESGLFFDGSLGTTLRNVLIRYNTFGDEQSCTAVFATPKDEGGYCSGIIFSQGESNNIRIEYNNFFHIENGVHFNQLAEWAPGKQNSVCISCSVRYNYIAHYHRIGIEIQTSTPENSILIEHNSIVDPVKSSWGTFAVSMACCQWGRTFGTLGFAPGYVFNDNVLVSTLPIGSMCPPYGVEFWGHGSQGLNSLVQGTFCNGYTWGYGAEPWAIAHNYICGPDFVAKGGYISDQQKQGNPPKQTDNVVEAKCSATPSTAPTIEPAGGAFSGSRTVTLRDKGLNTSIWFTTDGSSPVPGSGSAKLYTAPFTLTGTTTVKAVGMWGASNQPLTYPTGYGYIPSGVVSAVYTVSQSRADLGLSRLAGRLLAAGTR